MLLNCLHFKNYPNKSSNDYIPEGSDNLRAKMYTVLINKGYINLSQMMIQIISLTKSLLHLNKIYITK